LSKKKGKKKNDQAVAPRTVRKVRTFDSAKSDRLTADWATSSGSADAEAFRSLRRLRDRSRDLARNFDIINGLYDTMVNNIVGTGLKFQAKVPMQRGKELNTELNHTLEREFEKWCEAENCHTGGTLAFQDIESLCWRSIIEAGEVFIRFVYQPFGVSKIPLGLEILEADQLADQHYSPPGLRQTSIMADGIELDKWGRPLAYWFWPHHPGDVRAMAAGNNQPERIPADQILHLYRPRRPNQHRGLPWLYCSLLTMQHVRRYIEGEVVAARLQNAIAGFIKRPEDDATMPTPGEDLEDDDERTLLEDIAPGAIEYLNPGEEFQGFAPNRPNSDAVAFVNAMQRGLAAGQAVSYEATSRDYSQTSYSSARSAILEERKSYRIHQGMSVRQFHKKVYLKWLEMAVLSGVVSVGTGYETNPDLYRKHKWIAPGWEWVDPEKDARASILMLRAGMTTYTDILGEQGRDIEEVWDVLAREMALAKKLGIELDLSLSGPVTPPDVQEEDAPKNNGNGNGKKALNELILLGNGHGN
jgi:lambda family phage portal protein